MTRHNTKQKSLDQLPEGGEADDLWQALDLLPQADLSAHFTASTLARIKKEQNTASRSWFVDHINRFFTHNPWQIASVAAACLLAVVSLSTFWNEREPAYETLLAEQLQPEDIAIVEQLDTLLALEENELWIVAFFP